MESHLSESVGAEAQACDEEIRHGHSSKDPPSIPKKPIGLVRKLQAESSDSAQEQSSAKIEPEDELSEASVALNAESEVENVDVDPWAEVVVSDVVHYNFLTSEIRIPSLPSTSVSTLVSSMSLHNIERCGSGDGGEIMNKTIEGTTPTSDVNEEVRCPQEPHTLPPPVNLDLAEIESIEISRKPQFSSPPTHDFLELRPAPAAVGGGGGNEDVDVTETNSETSTVIVSKLQELVIKKNMRNTMKVENIRRAETGLDPPETTTTVENPMPPTSSTCIKYKVHQSPNGVTTISIDPKSEPVTLLTPPPVIHHIINLPPRKASIIRNRRRKTTDDISYEKASRLSQLMMTDYKVNLDRPPATNHVNGGTVSTNGLIEGKNIIKGNMESMGRSMRRKVGSWYRRRVKTPVEQLSIDLGLDSIKFPILIPFKCNNNGIDPRSCHHHQRQDSVDGWSPEPEEIENPTDQRFIEGLACDQGQNEFEELRRVVKQGGDFCKDLAAVLQERSDLESTYAKGLSKLSAKLLKASKEATGSVANAWQAVAAQIDTQAELHRIWSTALLDEVAKPLRNSTETQHKIRKSVEVLVEKTTRNLAEWRMAEAKAKRQCFSSSKEFEKIQENSCSVPSTPTTPASNGPIPNGGTLTNISTINLHNQANSVLAEVRARSRVLSVPPPDKDPIKLEAKRRKAEEAVRRADIEYYTFCVRSERARLEWEGAIRNGSTCLRTLEEEKLALLKELACKYFQHFNDFIPKLLRSSESLEEPIKTCNVDQDMHSVVDIRRHAGAEQLLPDFYAEDSTNLMKKERRMEALQKFLSVIKQDLERERKGASSIEGLARTIGDASPKIDTAHHDLSDKLYYVKAMLLYLEGTRTKIDNAMADQEGRQRANAPITQYMRHQRDKQGLPQTILKVPTWARDECLNQSSSSSSATDSGSGSARSLSPDWKEKDRSPADGIANRHDVEFDEFSSEGSEHINEDVFEDTSSSPPIPVANDKEADFLPVPIPNVSPSIGRCRVIYDYDSNMFDELTIKTGEILNVHDKQDDGWWLGELNGQVGIFPATYVEEINQ